MREVFSTWDSLYWAIPKEMKSFVKTSNGDYGWG